MDHVRLQRRTVLGIGIAAAAVGVASCHRELSAPAWRFFSQEEARTVDAICEQIIPGDQDPGAHEAGVVNYIDLQLSSRFRRFQKVYRSGVAAVDQASLSQFHKTFTELAATEQIVVLESVERDHPSFFSLILNHTRQGFYGDPRHGGNRDRVSWKMVGLASPPIRGRQRYDGPGVG
jgi:gluconate 2-dehydrogenase gamma chain